jgi:hypothetical protein
MRGTDLRLCAPHRFPQGSQKLAALFFLKSQIRKFRRKFLRI